MTGHLSVGRALPTATLLPNGLVLLAGGLDINWNGLANADLYNPATGTFTPTGNLQTARGWSTATLLNTGQVLVTGGATTATATHSLARIICSGDGYLHGDRQPKYRARDTRSIPAEQRPGADRWRL
jgi:hypothetical protein